MRFSVCAALLLISAVPGWTCPGCYGSGQPWQGAEGPGGMNLGRLKRVYSTTKYNHPVKIEDPSKVTVPGTAAKNGEPIPLRVDKAAVPKKPSSKAPK